MSELKVCLHKKPNTVKFINLIKKKIKLNKCTFHKLFDYNIGIDINKLINTK